MLFANQSIYKKISDEKQFSKFYDFNSDFLQTVVLVGPFYYCDANDIDHHATTEEYSAYKNEFKKFIFSDNGVTDVDAGYATFGLTNPAALTSTLTEWVIINSTHWKDLRHHICFKSGNPNIELFSNYQLLC